MSTINDFDKLEYLLALSGAVSKSAEDEYFQASDEAEELKATHFPTAERFVRTVVHHYRLATVVQTTQVICNTRRNSIIHIYH